VDVALVAAAPQNLEAGVDRNAKSLLDRVLGSTVDLPDLPDNDILAVALGPAMPGPGARPQSRRIR
jgi:hypothetical protein